MSLPEAAAQADALAQSGDERALAVLGALLAKALLGAAGDAEITGDGSENGSTTPAVAVGATRGGRR